MSSSPGAAELAWPINPASSREGVGALGCSIAAIPFKFQISPLCWKGDIQGRVDVSGTHALTNSDRPALIMTATGEIVTSAELENRSRCSANWLFDAGSTQEVENVLVLHPAIADVAVIGIPDQDRGEQVKAIVQLLPGMEGSDNLSGELIAFVKNESYCRYEAPCSIDFAHELPRSRTGKLTKQELPSRYWSEKAA